MVERFGVYILEQSVTAVPELIMGETGAAVEFIDKASSPFRKPVDRN